MIKALVAFLRVLCALMVNITLSEFYVGLPIRLCYCRTELEMLAHCWQQEKIKKGQSTTRAGCFLCGLKNDVYYE